MPVPVWGLRHRPSSLAPSPPPCLDLNPSSPLRFSLFPHFRLECHDSESAQSSPKKPSSSSLRRLMPFFPGRKPPGPERGSSVPVSTSIDCWPRFDRFQPLRFLLLDFDNYHLLYSETCCGLTLHGSPNFSLVSALYNLNVTWQFNT